MKHSKITLAVMAILAGQMAPAAEQAVGRGKMLDRSDATRTSSRGNEEFNTPLQGLEGPSGVRSRDFRVMRESAATLPAVPATVTQTLTESERGALFESGKDDLLPASLEQLARIAGELAGKRNLRLLVVGHADTQRLSAATRKRFRDNQGLSEARAFAVAQNLRARLGLPAEAFTIRGESDLKPVADNSTPAGMAANRRVELSIWYDVDVAVAAPPATPAAPKPAAMQDREECTASAATAAPLRITIDGMPQTQADPVTEADHQRCVDVAMNRHDLQLQFDPLKAEPALNAQLTPNGAVAGEAVTLSTYSNYRHWIKRGELRFFAAGQDERETPLLVVPVEVGSDASWTPPAGFPAESHYLLRVYDEKGRFDETVRKRFSVLDRARPLADQTTSPREALAIYGTSALRIRNIPLSGGSITVSGRNVGRDGTVTVDGVRVPVDDAGRFVMRQLLPSGTHAVNVVTEDAAGRTEYHRNLTLGREAWFYVAQGELTLADNRTTGPAALVTGDTERFDRRVEVTGRGAFYAKGQFGDDYRLTMSADTRERPLEDLFSNFTSKDPRYLLQRIDGERGYPVFGDDSSSEWDAPTYGRFYARLERHDSRLLWGNFQTAWTGLQLNQYSRGLYGAELLYKSEGSTGFGERRATSDLFVAEPGTLASREEFRGTGGSLYYLHRQDITRGSERLWVEVRDAVSGIPLQRTQLVPGIDYDLSYLQGRILLRSPLASVADGSTLVRDGSLGGNPAFLVATYEYTPALSTFSDNVYGLRSAGWLNDHVRLGVSGYRQGGSADRQTIGGVDATLRYAAGTWLDVEAARSKGPGNELNSLDGGFNFADYGALSSRAGAFRVQGALDLSEMSASLRGRGSLYWQDRAGGFSGPGSLTSGETVLQRGMAFSLPVGERSSVDLKVDDRAARSQSREAEEVAIHHQVDPRWSVSLGARHDYRDTGVVNASPLLSQDGSRTDAILRFDFRPLGVVAGQGVTANAGAAPASVVNTAAAPATAPVTGAPGVATLNGILDVTHSTVPSAAAAEAANRPSAWSAYGYVQGTVSRDGDREEANRVGLGGLRQVNDRFRVGAELSQGTGGIGGAASGDYRISDRANVYVSHTIESEREDSNYRGRFDNTTVGGRVKLSDQVSIYNEARSARGAGPDSLTNAFGVDLAPNDRWTYGFKAELGTVSDPLSGDLKRRALGAGVVYKQGRYSFTSNAEYRHETGTAGTRDTWLVRDSGKVQLNSDWRLLGKLNFSFSDASRGNFYDGNFIDAALGGAWRPVDNDRWNGLMQYRYYYTLPSPGQVNLGDQMLDYAQRSHILSVDLVHDLLPWLSVGGKYGLRMGSLRDTRVGGDWHSSRADLAVLRADLHFVHKWDVMIEGRRLSVHEADTVRSGLLAAVYRELGGHVKLGAGYNFTDFSDDLTDLSFRSRGPFLNLLGTF